ncbi:phytoene desaturase family protein [Brevibacterium litoralis]|uniref:phytoene desaturase family protein n=1 Tax=Brevibacterium litoralis TaxID=3138935 RepID=UPI0032EF4597
MTARTSPTSPAAEAPSLPRPRTVVVGAGISGLASAALLAREGHEVTLLEKNAQVGGRAGTHEADGFRWDTGPSWYLMPEVFDHFFRLFGTTSAAQLDLVTLDPGYRVFASAMADTDSGVVPPIDVPLGRDRVRDLFERLEPGSGPRLDAYLDLASDAYDLALRHFLHTTFDDLTTLAAPEVLARLGDLVPMLTGTLGDRIDRTVGHPALRQILGYPAVFLANFPAGTPAIYQLMSRLDLVDGVQYPRGGMYALIEAIARLARETGVEILTDHEVTAIHVDPRVPSATAVARATAGLLGRLPGVTTGRVREVVARAADGLHVFEADHVVTTADLHHVETSLLPRAYRSRPPGSWHRRDPGMGAIVMLLGVEGRVPELAHHSLFLTADWRANFAAVFGERAGGRAQLPEPASVYVCAPSRTDDRVAPAGAENIFVLVPCPADAGLRADDPRVQEYCDRLLADLGRRAGIADLPGRITYRKTLAPAEFRADLHAWHGTVLGPAHTLFQSVWFRGRPRNSRVAGLWHAGAFTAPGVGLPMCLIGAQNVLKAVRGDTSTGPLDPETVWEQAPEREAR